MTDDVDNQVSWSIDRDHLLWLMYISYPKIFIAIKKTPFQTSVHVKYNPLLIGHLPSNTPPEEAPMSNFEIDNKPQGAKSRTYGMAISDLP